MYIVHVYREKGSTQVYYTYKAVMSYVDMYMYHVKGMGKEKLD